jgi:type VI secretion system secreted protein VgrG
MGDELKQQGRTGSLTTPLGEDQLVLTGFDGAEGLSELFEYRIDALSTEKNIDFDRVLGQTCTVRLKLFDVQDRYFSGIAVEAQAVGMLEDLYSYRLVLRPALWLLTRATNCRIFHNKTALEIVKNVLSERNVNFKPLANREYPKLEYCVQYRETDFSFVSRLMEQHGIYYYFEHSANDHIMVVADSIASHTPIEGLETIRYLPTLVGLASGEQSFVTWSSERRFRTGKVELRDYNFVRPNENLTGDAQATEKYEKAKDFEFYDYPGKHDDKGAGENYAKIRLGAEQSIDHRRFAAGEAVNLFPGGLVTVREHSVEGENAQYLVLRCVHRFATQFYRSTARVPRSEQPYHGNFELAPAAHEFRAPIITPKPVVHGPQTAKVVAGSKDKDSEEIDVDEHGRIKVRFHWDRNEDRSCWLRVAQMWAGSNWGSQFIPRIGMEVVVEFLEGDPDRPIIVGAVYNGNNKHPYALPDNKTQSGLKSDSSQGHGGYNELMFEDKKGSEKVSMRAEKDHNVLVRNQQTVNIGENYSDGGASRQTTLVNGDDTLQLSQGSQTINIQVGKQTTTVMQSIGITSTTDSITLTAGASSITISQGSIQISSPQISLSAPEIDLN